MIPSFLVSGLGIRVHEGRKRTRIPRDRRQTVRTSLTTPSPQHLDDGEGSEMLPIPYLEASPGVRARYAGSILLCAVMLDFVRTEKTKR